jgi:hypothetical protein
MFFDLDFEKFKIRFISFVYQELINNLRNLKFSPKYF